MSVFHFDHDPPRVSSPWATPPPERRSKQGVSQDSVANPATAVAENPVEGILNVLSDGGGDHTAITKLEAEPQDGPTEYKLHLLLRRCRSFTRSSTGRRVSGSLRRPGVSTPSAAGRSASEYGLPNASPPLSATQSRQLRLVQLTTQLLWRLQQSCPDRTNAKTELILPVLPDEAQLATPAVPQRLLPGLEDSKGALYEIGVADDGTFVGLVEDEMEESLNNLRVMAAALGCRVQVLRMVPVGDCEWVEYGKGPGSTQQNVRTGKLFVAEALVRPDQHVSIHDTTKYSRQDSNILPQPPVGTSQSSAVAENAVEHQTQQMRVTLTGATGSGKSSLLGSLSTATLDNGRGKSRLSLLKHRHEIASGMTSSVTQELIGYRDLTGGDGSSTQVISYGAGDVSSWTDIHTSAEDGRLVFLSDSAGHLRFRRTTVRGLVGWSPHWTLLCIPADSADDSTGKTGASPSSQEILGSAAADVDLSQAHLQLCLDLDLPLVVVITKLDIATKLGFRQTLSRLLSALKAAGKKPCIVSDASGTVTEADLNEVTENDILEADKVIETFTSLPPATVPIVLTSAVKGTGIGRLHAFLKELPLPDLPSPADSALHTLFHVEDVYTNVLGQTKPSSLTNSPTDRTIVLGGILRYGTLRIGDEILLGPFSTDTFSDDSDSGSGKGSTPPNRSRRHSPIRGPRSFPGAHTNHASTLRTSAYGLEKQAEWRRVRLTSLRNLRLPVRTLHARQVGTIGVTPIDLPILSQHLVRPRKGMVLVDGEPKAQRVIAVKFTGKHAEAVKNLGVGTAAVVYFASVRSSAKVVSVAPEKPQWTGLGISNDDDDDGAFGFGFDEDEDEDHDSDAGALKGHPASATTVTFQFIASREFVEMDVKVLVLPGGGPGLSGANERGEKGIAGLEGFVGRVVERSV